MKNVNLIYARKVKGLTQEQLGKRIDYNKSTVSNWENGYSLPRIKDAFRLAEILEKDISFLFFNQYVQDPHTLFVGKENLDRSSLLKIYKGGFN